MKRFTFPFVAGALATLLAPLVTCAAPIKKAAPPKATTPKPKAAAPNATLDEHPLIARLKQFPNGPGILIAEPLPAKGTADATTDLGAGCARWLHLIVGGQGELDRTPLWTSANRLRTELKKPRLQLAPADLPFTARATGVTHVALGEIASQRASVTLTYRLYNTSTGKVVAGPFALEGTPDEVTKGLPALARDLAMGCGAKSPAIPATVGETPDDLQFLGALPWLPGQIRDTATEARLRELAGLFQIELLTKGLPAPRPLAGFMGMLLEGARQSTGSLSNVLAPLIRALPGNTLILGEIAHSEYRLDRRNPDRLRAELDAGLAKHPHNYLLHTANTYHRALTGTPAETRTTAETAVRCATANTAVWRLLSAKIATQAFEIRQGRTIGEMTEKELADCQRFYADELPADLKAAMLDDRNVAAWNDVSSSAAFLGEAELADGAFGKAFTLDPTNSELLWWGLELYQPKWQDDPQKLRLVAEAALAACEKWHPEERVKIAISVRHVGFKNVWTKIASTEAERRKVEAYFRKYPDQD